MDPKLWYTSKTLWGSLIAMFAGVATLAGVQLDATLQDQLAELIVGAANLAGGALAWYGRLRANTSIASALVSK